MSFDTLVATTREVKGKGASRRLRREQNVVPGVVYGAGKAAKSISLSHDMLLHALDHEAFASSILSLKIDGGRAEKVIAKALQRHPYKPKVLHIDFMRVSSKTEVTMNVPLHLIGEAIGLKDGGVLSQTMNEVEVVCLPKDLPELLELDISDLELNASKHLSDIQLPEGVTLTQYQSEEDEDLQVASISIPKVVEEPEPEIEAEGEEGETAEADSSDEPKAEGDAESTEGDKAE